MFHITNTEEENILDPHLDHLVNVTDCILYTGWRKKRGQLISLQIF